MGCSPRFPGFSGQFRNRQHAGWTGILGASGGAQTRAPVRVVPHAAAIPAEYTVFIWNSSGSGPTNVTPLIGSISVFWVMPSSRLPLLAASQFIAALPLGKNCMRSSTCAATPRRSHQLHHDLAGRRRRRVRADDDRGGQNVAAQRFAGAHFGQRRAGTNRNASADLADVGDARHGHQAAGTRSWISAR